MILALALAFAATAPLSSLAAGEANAGAKTRPALEVIMYSTATCTYCQKARQWFSSHQVAWDERDIETSATAQSNGRNWVVSARHCRRQRQALPGFMESAIEAEIAKYR
jgi:glutaredoxin